MNLVVNRSVKHLSDTSELLLHIQVSGIRLQGVSLTD